MLANILILLTQVESHSTDVNWKACFAEVGSPNFLLHKVRYVPGPNGAMCSKKTAAGYCA